MPKARNADIKPGLKADWQECYADVSVNFPGRKRRDFTAFSPEKRTKYRQASRGFSYIGKQLCGPVQYRLWAGLGDVSSKQAARSVTRCFFTPILLDFDQD